MRSVLALLLILLSAFSPFGLAQESATAPTGLSDANAALESGQLAPPDAAGAPAASGGDQQNFDFFSDAPVKSTEVVELPPEESRWLTIGGPIALLCLFFAMLLQIWWLVPFDVHSLDLNLRDLPPAAKRGIAMAVGMFGVAFCFGATEIWYQLQIHGSAEAYFAQMSLGKLIAFTHAHLFGFTTSFFIVGIPFSLQFNHIKTYQWVFPAGLAASLTDVMSWWGIKFVSPNFEWVSMFCGIIFSSTYLWMLIGLLRVLLFPDVIWASDKDRSERLAAKLALETREGDY